MRKLAAVALAGGALFVSLACTAKISDHLDGRVVSVLEGSDTIVLYALHPNPHEAEGRPASDAESFHDYRILGSASLEDGAKRSELVDLLFQGIVESDGTVAACFNPRHGVRAVNGAETVDLVICFECLSMSIHGPVERSNATTVSRHERAVSAIYRDAGLEIHGE